MKLFRNLINEGPNNTDGQEEGRRGGYDKNIEY